MLERANVAAGSSWGNAGWLTPGLAAPLPEPSVLAQGLRAVLSPGSPVVIPRRPSLGLLRFFTRFARNSTWRRWRAGMDAYLPLNALALDSFDRLIHGGVQAQVHEADPFLACYRTTEDRRVLLRELQQIAAAGQDVGFEAITGEEARRAEPALPSAVGAAIRIQGQRYVHPPQFMNDLATSVRARGGTVLTWRPVSHLRATANAVEVVDGTGTVRRFDAVVVANGAELSDLAAPFGVRQRVQAGRGYSFTAGARRLPAGPIYFPTRRIACTPLRSAGGDRLRVAGTMEFRSPSATLDRRRIKAMVGELTPLVDGLDLHDRHEEWVGSRPCTVDGLPLVGRTKSEGVFRRRRPRDVGHGAGACDRAADRTARRRWSPRPCAGALRSHPLSLTSPGAWLSSSWRSPTRRPWDRSLPDQGGGDAAEDGNRVHDRRGHRHYELRMGRRAEGEPATGTAAP